jgi:hypothetical protein
MMTTLIKNMVLAALFSFLPLWAFFCLNFAAMELENPFGTDDNDLPMRHFQTEMNNSLMMLLHPNGDLIPGVNPKCEMDFFLLHAAHTSEEEEDHADVSGAHIRCKTSRLSDFRLLRTSDTKSTDSQDMRQGHDSPPAVEAARSTTQGSQCDSKRVSENDVHVTLQEATASTTASSPSKEENFLQQSDPAPDPDEAILDRGGTPTLVVKPISAKAIVTNQAYDLDTLAEAHGTSLPVNSDVNGVGVYASVADALCLGTCAHVPAGSRSNRNQAETFAQRGQKLAEMPRPVALVQR